MQIVTADGPSPPTTKPQPTRGTLLLAIIPFACMIGVVLVTRVLRLQSPTSILPIVLSLAVMSVAARQLRSFSVRKSVLRRVAETAAAVGAMVLIAVPQPVRMMIVFNPAGAFLIVAPILLHLALATHRVLAKPDLAGGGRQLADIIGEYIPRNLAHAVATELSVLWYALTWWRASRAKAGVSVFGYDRGVRPILWGLIFVGALELVLAHILVVAIWGLRSTWVILALSEIAIVYLFGILSAVGKMPIELSAGGLRVRAAMFIDEFIEREDIVRVEVGAPTMIKAAGFLKASLFTAPNVRVHLASPRMIARPFRRKSLVDLVGFAVDDPKAFRLAAAESDFPIG